MDKLLKNLQKFLELRKAREELQKRINPHSRGVHDPHPFSVKGGESDSGMWAKQKQPENMDPRQKEMRSDANKKVSRMAHKRNLNDLKEMPKPNLPKTEKVETAFKISPPKIMSAGNPVGAGPKTTVSATSSTGGMGRRGGSRIRETTTWKGPLNKKEKALIRPDVVSTPELFDEKGTLTTPQMVSGPTMMNVRKAGPNDGERANPIDMGEEVNETGLRLSEKDEGNLHHIYERESGQRISSKPAKLSDINRIHGGPSKMWSNGFYTKAATPAPKPQASPQKLRRSSSEK